jgi:hypothetical protein
MSQLPADASRLVELKTFYQACDPIFSIEPDHRYYVPFFENNPKNDPIKNIMTRILFASSESVNLLTGFRGNGKTTQLHRLKNLLELAGCKVFYIDMNRVMLTTKPIEISDLLLSMMAAFSEAIKKEEGLDVIRSGYIERLARLLESHVITDDINLSAGTGDLSAEVGIRLQRDPVFKENIQNHLRGKTTTLINDAREFVTGIVDTLRKREKNPDLKVVLLVDSLEQIRGQYENARAVQQSVSETLSGQANNLIFPLLHVVYTIPPYLSILAPNVSRLFGGNSIACWPNIHTRNKMGQPDTTGIAIMRILIDKRYTGWRNFFDESQIERLAHTSGGDLRNYLRLVRDSIIALSATNQINAKIDDSTLNYIEQQLLNESLPIAINDAKWLLRIHEEKNASLNDVELDISRLVRFQDGNLIMNYQNGEVWCDIHPLIIPEVKKLAALPPRADLA